MPTPKVDKILKRFFFISFILVTLATVLVYYWITTTWKNIFTESEMTALAASVNSSPQLHVNFYTIHDKLYPGKRSQTMNQELMDGISSLVGYSDDQQSCECRHTFILLERSSNTSFTSLKNLKGLTQRYLPYFAGWGIEKFASPEKCFDFNFNVFLSEAQYSGKRLYELSAVPVSLMSDDEIIELLLLRKSPGHYDKYRNPEIFANAHAELKEKLK